MKVQEFVIWSLLEVSFKAIRAHCARSGAVFVLQRFFNFNQHCLGCYLILIEVSACDLFLGQESTFKCLPFPRQPVPQALPWYIAFFHHYQGSIDFNTVNIHRTVGMYFLVSTGNRGDIEWHDLQRSYYPIHSLLPGVYVSIRSLGTVFPHTLLREAIL